MTKFKYYCKVCGGQKLWMSTHSRWSYEAQRFVQTEVDPEYNAHCDDCDEYVDWDRHDSVGDV